MSKSWNLLHFYCCFTLLLTLHQYLVKSKYYQIWLSKSKWASIWFDHLHCMSRFCKRIYLILPVYKLKDKIRLKYPSWFLGADTLYRFRKSFIKSYSLQCLKRVSYIRVSNFFFSLFSSSHKQYLKVSSTISLLVTYVWNEYLYN